MTVGTDARGEGITTDVASSALFPPELLGAALDALPEGVAIFDVDWTIVYVNPAGAGLLTRGWDQLGRPQHLDRPARARRVDLSRLSAARPQPGRTGDWQGHYPPTGRWLSATTVRIGDRLQVGTTRSCSTPMGGSSAAAP